MGDISTLPTESLIVIFGKLSAKDLASCHCVCSGWNSLATAPSLWKPLCLSRWKKWKPSRWDGPVNEGCWSRIYRDRHRLDQEALKALESLPHPKRRQSALRSIVSCCGEDVEELLFAESRREGPMTLGRRYWAGLAHQKLMAACAAEKLTLLKGMESPDSLVDEGALVLARAFDPASGSAWVPGFLDDLAAELRRRAAALPAAPDRRELLAMLNRLLFGPRHPSDAAAGAGAGEGEERLPTIPPDGYGLGLAGNRDNYYDVRNSLLHKVLLRRRGIPISLAVIQCAVAQRCGLRLQAVGMPCHLLTKLGEAGSPDELFVDCFDGGRIMTREETFELMATIGLPCSPRFLAPMKQHEVHERMCANLVHIFRQLEDHRPLWQVLEVLQAFKPTPEYLLLHAQVALYRLGDTEAALSSTERVQALGSMDQQIVFPMIAQMQAEARRIREEHDRVCGMVSPPPEGLGCRVGDIVRHRRFGYRGVIAGWDVRCMASEDWKAQMNVGALSRGELQPFYRVLVDCRDRESQSTYVAQENIILAVEEALGAQPGEVTHDAEAWEVQNKELGAHFEGLSVDRDGEFWPHYVPNAFLAARHPCKAR